MGLLFTELVEYFILININLRNAKYMCKSCFVLDVRNLIVQSTEI